MLGLGVLLGKVASKSPGGIIAIRGGVPVDGDWVKMTSENWEAVGDTNWEDWNATSDS